MAQGMDDVDEVRTSRQLDTVLETVGMDCNPGYVVAPEMRDPMRCAITCRSFFVFFLGVRFATFAAIVNRRGALVFPSSRETKRAVFSDIHNMYSND